MLRSLPGISSLLISTLPVHSPEFFPKTSPDFFLCWLWLTPVPVYARRIKQVTLLLDAGSRFKCSRNINRLQNMCNCFLVVVVVVFLVLRSEIAGRI